MAEHLRSLGLGPDGWSVATSAQAAAQHLRGELAAGTSVVAVGGPGVTAALIEFGLEPVTVGSRGAAKAAALVQGLGSEVSWTDLATASVLVREGMRWVVTNRDMVVPSDRGSLPGNGALVDVVRTASGTDPHFVAGKPGPALFELSRAVLGTGRRDTLVCGDRLDTDVAGAHAAGLDSLLVLSGVTSLRDVALAAPLLRPTYVAADLRALLAPALRPMEYRSGLCVMSARGIPEPPRDLEPDEQLAAAVGLAWWIVDAGGQLCPDPEPWQDLEDQLGVGRVSSRHVVSEAG